MEWVFSHFVPLPTLHKRPEPTMATESTLASVLMDHLGCLHCLSPFQNAMGAVVPDEYSRDQFVARKQRS